MKLMFKRLRQYVRAHWRLLVGIIVGTLAVCGLMLFQLGSITGGLSSSEVRQATFSSSWRHIADNPLNAPLTVVQWVILTLIPHHGNTVTRAASPIFGVLALAAFAYILRRWYGVRSAVYGSVIFGLCSWFFHASRYAGPDVLYMWAIPTLLAILIAWDRHHEQKKVAYLALAGLAVLSYIPGMIWFVLAIFVLQPHILLDSWQAAKTVVARLALLLLPLVLLLPLIVAFVGSSSLLRTWIGLPAHFGSAESVGRGLLHSVSFFVYKGPATPELWLVRAPILNFFATVLAVLGALFYAKHMQAPRTRLLATFFVIGALLFALSGPVTISILVPLMYLLVAAGFGYLLHEWLQVFPRNPLARAVGFSLLGIAVVLACAYEFKSYYIAWPHNPATEAAFHNHH
ncbi:MAG TPA: hypothetical protein VN031_00695 [Candidatus Microsaccharimonas sp.]|nr:hypothetical protein [Candidatus Microsaccharimonas sp.]